MERGLGGAVVDRGDADAAEGEGEEGGEGARGRLAVLDRLCVGLSSSLVVASGCHLERRGRGREDKDDAYYQLSDIIEGLGGLNLKFLFRAIWKWIKVSGYLYSYTSFSAIDQSHSQPFKSKTRYGVDMYIGDLNFYSNA